MSVCVARVKQRIQKGILFSIFRCLFITNTKIEVLQIIRELGIKTIHKICMFRCEKSVRYGAVLL